MRMNGITKIRQMFQIPGLDLEKGANLGFSRFAKHHVLYKIFHREHKEERSPCDTINSWITENGILHYCPMCDKLENCKNEKGKNYKRGSNRIL